MRLAFLSLTCFYALAMAAGLALAGCSGAPRRAGPWPAVQRPAGVPVCSSLLNSDWGAGAVGVFCAGCRGAAGEGFAGDAKSGKAKLGSIVDGSYLALISDQGLRSIVVAGRADEGMPDWRTHRTQPMTDQQITDIVAWLASKRTSDPGQPYPTALYPTGTGNQYK